MPTLNRVYKRTFKRVPTSVQRFYKSAIWRNVRLNKLQVDPVCEVHKSIGKLIDCTANSPIDHIIPLAQSGSQTDMDNLMTLCTECHERKSGMESRGFMIDWVNNHMGERIPTQGARELIINILAKSL